MDETVLAIDPGREKCGIAVVSREKGVMEKTILPPEALAPYIHQAASRYGISKIILGDRTGAHKIQETLARFSGAPNFPVEKVDEHFSTQEARRRYWRENPPKGVRRLIPVTLQTPPRPYDDYVAVILAERYFQGKAN